MTSSETSPTKAATASDAALKRGSRLLLGESGVGAVALGVHSNFVSPMAIRMGATNLQMGLLVAAAELFSAISQLMAARLQGWLGGRKRMVVLATLLGALPWALLCLVPLLPTAYQVWVLIPCGALAYALLVLIEPIWGSWMADLVPSHRRGRYLGVRGSTVTLASTVVAITGAAVLDRLDGAVLWGFAGLFVLALLARLTSAAFFTRVPDPRPEARLSPPVAPWKQYAALRGTATGRFIRFAATFHFFMGIASPFFAVYLLRILEVSYLTFVMLGLASSLSTAVAMPFWGRLVDSRGSLFVVLLTIPPVCVWPTAFILAPNVWWLVPVHMVAGATYSGWVLAGYNFIVQKSGEGDRPSMIGLFKAMVSTGGFFGLALGGIIAPFMPRILEHQIMSLFLISTTLRLIAFAVMYPRIASR
ncbi:MAG: MFS transporter [SAR202 cluster bacterium]|nr:MFS transporter [SAR202 cluster bacterium]